MAEPRVVDSDGAAVADAEVLGWRQYLDEPYRRTRSQADGTFTLEHLGEDFYVTAHTQRLACSQGVRGDLAPGSHAEGLVIELAPIEPLHGVVLAPDRTPLEGAEVWVEGEREVDLGYSSARRSTWEYTLGIDTRTTAADGSFRFGNLYRGSFTIHLSPPGERLLELELEVTAPATGLELVLDRRAMRKVVLTGRVTDAFTGGPIEHFEVTPRRADGWGFVREVRDQEGRYEIAGLEPGDLTVEARAEGYAPYETAARRYDVGEHRLNLALLPARTLILSVTDSAGRPHRHGRVEVVGIDGRSRSMQMGRGSRSNQSRIENGRAVLHGLPAEPLTLRITVAEEVQRIREAVHEGDVDLTTPLVGELEVVIDSTSAPTAPRGLVQVLALVAASDVDEAELRRNFARVGILVASEERVHLASIGAEESRQWVSERFESGAITYVEAKVDAEILDAGGAKYGEYHLTPRPEGGFHGEVRTWSGGVNEGRFDDSPVPAAFLSLPIGSYTLRARVEGYPVVEQPLEVRGGEVLRYPLVVRRH